MIAPLRRKKPEPEVVERVAPAAGPFAALATLRR
jgi:hypothetical protein